MEYQFYTDQVEKTLELGEKLGHLLYPGCLLTLEGELGAGKTTLTKGIGLGLGVTSIINSPTFTILKQYTGKIPLYHFDAYRLEDSEEDLGFEEMFDGDGVCVIEWPRFIEYMLPMQRLAIHIKKIDYSKRQWILTPIGEKYENICKELIKCEH